MSRWRSVPVALAVWAFASPAIAQISSVSSPAAPPAPASTIPQSELVSGSVGTSTDYMRADARLPRITRVAIVTTDGSGNWSVTWSSALAATPVVLAIPVSSGTQPVMCVVATASTTTATGKCWVGQTTVLNLSIVTAGLTLNPNANAASMSVQVLAIPTTQ